MRHWLPRPRGREIRVDVRDRQLEDLVSAVAQVAAGRGIGVADPAVGLHPHDRVRGVLHGEMHHAQGAFRALARGDVLVGAQDADDAALGVLERQLAGAQPASGSRPAGLRLLVVQLGLAGLP